MRRRPGQTTSDSPSPAIVIPLERSTCQWPKRRSAGDPDSDADVIMPTLVSGVAARQKLGHRPSGKTSPLTLPEAMQQPRLLRDPLRRPAGARFAPATSLLMEAIAAAALGPTRRRTGSPSERSEFPRPTRGSSRRGRSAGPWLSVRIGGRRGCLCPVPTARSRPDDIDVVIASIIERHLGRRRARYRDRG
jgi:hypothetical protein